MLEKVMDQDKFLKHQNMNGSFSSMKDVQNFQQKLWADTYVASIRADLTVYSAVNNADAAVAAFNTRFIPD